MNFLFPTPNASPAKGPVACSTTLTNAVPSNATPACTTHNDIDLVIEIESSFHGVLLGLPEESPGAVLNATAILHVRRKPIRAAKLMATFDGRIKVLCSDGAAFGSEQYRERVLAHKDWVLWEAGVTNTGSSSKNHIPVGTHYYPLSIQLDGALPPTFSGRHGSIRYILSSTLLRPIFYNDISTVKEIDIKRCLVDELSRKHNQDYSVNHAAESDLGSLLVNQLFRAGIHGILEGNDNELDFQTSGLSQGPTTITHHNTYKELLRYTALSPPIAHLEGGLVQVDLTLEPLPPGSYIYSIAYGLKELIYYRSSATGNPTGNKSEVLYPIGQQTVIIPRDQERERSMASAGAGASTRQLLELRPCPLLTNVDLATPLIEIRHRIVCNVVIVLPDSASSRGDNSSESASGVPGGGGILRRLNIASHTPTPNLTLVDPSGMAVNNNAIFLGELTRSIFEPAVRPVTVELNDTPPPPPSSQLESTVLEFPIILTSRHPSVSMNQHPSSNPISYSGGRPAGEDIPIENGGYANQTMSFSSQSSLHPSSPLIVVATQAGNGPGLQKFVHNQEISSTIIPTTGTTIRNSGGPFVVPELLGSSTSSSSSISSTDFSNAHGNSSSSSQSLPSVGHGDQATFVVERAPPDSSHNSVNDMESHTRTRMQSGISAGLRAAAAAAASCPTPSESSIPSGPPSYGRHNPQVGHSQQEQPPKYEDVIDGAEAPESGPGITIPHSTPMPVPVQSLRYRQQSVSPRSMSPRSASALQSSPQLYQSMNSYSNSRVLSFSPSSSPIPLSGDGRFMLGRDIQGSSSPPTHGHARTGSTTSMLLSTSLARSQEQPISTAMSMMSIQTTGTQAQYSVQGSTNQQGSLDRRPRQRSLGTATIIGSLGRNGGYLSQQPSPLTISSCGGPAAMPTFENNISPPAYADA
ncbi:hypothetical protein BGZ80_003232 [Entomortierella chlamydospora]|uniref:Arrestin-like N-terminal domain-containing protein n=1 Tax=Entomortierella chlamydospora TaxID=101097 RepID=A0A9P6MNG2_9FUNG|nr:hypothetical protein BGZ79_000680 [Entomortierella chlamydospora]KAG0008625.1 hypothetical protein BGZ80_003232 [Entomortierella chlamydospora]